MNGICSALDGCVDDRARRSSELGGIGSRLDAELRKRVGRRLHGLNRTFLQIGGTRVVFYAVEREVVLRFQVSVRAETVGRGVGDRRIFLDAGFEQGEIGITPSVERQVADLLLLHDAADIGSLRIQQRHCRFHLNGL